MKRYKLNFILGITIVVLLNYVFTKLRWRIDFTENSQYTLSDATKNILKEVNGSVKITAYFSENLPPDVAKAKVEFEDILQEYRQYSSSPFIYVFINPNADEAVEKEAFQSGIQPVVLNVREKDQVKQQKAYLGAVVEFEGKKEVIPFISPGNSNEYALSTAIKKLTAKNKSKLGYITGHGEPELESLFQVKQSLEVLYEIEEVNLLMNNSKLLDYKTVILCRPLDSLNALELNTLTEYMDKGGNVFIAHSAVSANLQQAQGFVNQESLNQWLNEYGIHLDPAFVIDVNCSAVAVQQQQGFFSFATNVSFPYLPIIKNFSTHPATKGLEQVLLQFPSPVVFTQKPGIQFTPLAFTSEKSGREAAPLTFNVQRNWTEIDFKESKIPVAGLIEREGKGKLILIASGEFAINGQGQQMQQLNPDNVNLMVNAIDWMSDDSGLIDLRTKAITSRPLKEVDERTKTALKYFNFLLPILMTLLAGFIVYRYRKNQRMLRMANRY